MSGSFREDYLLSWADNTSLQHVHSRIDIVFGGFISFSIFALEVMSMPLEEAYYLVFINIFFLVGDGFEGSFDFFSN